MKTIKRISALVLAVLLMAGLSISAWAQEYDLYDGDITVTADGSSQTVTHCRTDGVHVTEDANPTITSNGKTTDHTLTIYATNDNAVANVTLGGVNIYNDPYNDGPAAVITEGSGSVVIELDGTNTVTSGTDHAGVEKNNNGTLTITDTNKDGGSLEATGGDRGAGIGGGNGADGTNITISGGEVTATGGQSGAGIGGGMSGAGTEITISGGTVTATGGMNGAGIGGGMRGAGTDITISGGTVTAVGVLAAGIGGGWNGDGTNITITGGEVTATGGEYGAGIGGGEYRSGTDITISGGTVTATGGMNGAGIGGGDTSAGSDITISGGTVTATGERRGAGIGGGNAGAGSNITISGDATVTATGNYGGAGIGGGGSNTGSDITISGDAQVHVTGSQESTAGDFSFGAGAAIGNGGGYSRDDNPPAGDEIDPDISTLTASGSISYYPAGTTVGQMQDGSVEPTKVVHGTYVPFSGVTFYTLSFDLGGGTIDGKSEYKLSAVFGQKIELPTPVKDGATFKGWKTTIDGEEVILEAGEQFTVKGAASFTAIWE